MSISSGEFYYYFTLQCKTGPVGATHTQLQLTVPAVLRDLFKEINPKTHGFFFLWSDPSLHPACLLNLPLCIWQGMGPSYRFYQVFYGLQGFTVATSRPSPLSAIRHRTHFASTGICFKTINKNEHKPLADAAITQKT